MDSGACERRSTVPPGQPLRWRSHQHIEKTDGPNQRDAACEPSRCSCPEGESLILRLEPALDLACLVDLFDDGIPVGIVRQCFSGTFPIGYPVRIRRWWNIRNDPSSSSASSWTTISNRMDP
jgi:hypothetical protein